VYQNSIADLDSGCIKIRVPLTDGAVGKPTLELGAGEALALDHFPVAIGERELEHGLGEIDAHDGQCSGRIHLGLPTVGR
jgi:hypothetical protein